MTIMLGNYEFEVLAVSREDIKGCDGITYHCARKIEVADDLDNIATILTLRHEVVHALLGTQGRALQKRFDVEEVCEFIAYRLPEINSIMDYIEKNLGSIKPANVSCDYLKRYIDGIN